MIMYKKVRPALWAGLTFFAEKEEFAPPAL